MLANRLGQLGIDDLSVGNIVRLVFEDLERLRFELSLSMGFIGSTDLGLYSMHFAYITRDWKSHPWLDFPNIFLIYSWKYFIFGLDLQRYRLILAQLDFFFHKAIH